MFRLVLFLVGVLALAAGLAWLADRPGNLLLTWQDYEIETSLFRAVVILTALVGLSVFAWSLLRQIWFGPAALNHYLTKRRQRRGLDALSTGMIAIGAGDRATATRYAVLARKALPNEPLTHLLRAQAAQLSGDKTTARRIFEAMLASPDTEQLGLRGLFLEAGREGEAEAQRQFAERALRLNPKLSWPIEALFELQCKAGDWAGALKTLAIARRHRHVERPVADRRRAVLLTAQAQQLEDEHPDAALDLALEAHGLAPSLIPAAAIAGRILASRGNTPRAARIIQKTWSKAPHPELATAYAYARIGDSPRDRLDRVKQLAALNPYSVESPIAVAMAAIEARQYDEARNALAPYAETNLTRRIAALMARIEAEENGDKGRAREWLARAVNAPRDPAWTADGVVSERWVPVSPVTGALDAFEWRVPVAELEGGERGALDHDFEDLFALGEPPLDSTDPKLIVAEASDEEDTARRRSSVPETSGAEMPGRERPPVTKSESAQTAGPAAVEAAERAPRTETTTTHGSAATKRTEPPKETSKKSDSSRTPSQVFKTSRAPDDPGTDLDDVDEPGSPLRPFRA